MKNRYSLSIVKLKDTHIKIMDILMFLPVMTLGFISFEKPVTNN